MRSHGSMRGGAPACAGSVASSARQPRRPARDARAAITPALARQRRQHRARSRAATRPRRGARTAPGTRAPSASSSRCASAAAQSPRAALCRGRVRARRAGRRSAPASRRLRARGSAPRGVAARRAGRRRSRRRAPRRRSAAGVTTGAGGSRRRLPAAPARAARRNPRGEQQQGVRRAASMLNRPAPRPCLSPISICPCAASSFASGTIAACASSTSRSFTGPSASMSSRSILPARSDRLPKNRSRSFSDAPFSASGSLSFSTARSSACTAGGVEALQVVEGEHQRLDPLRRLAVAFLQRGEEARSPPGGRGC